MKNPQFNVLNDPNEVIIDFEESRVVDMSAIEALDKITERHHKVGKKIQWKHLIADCKKLLKNTEEIIEVNVGRTLLIRLFWMICDREKERGIVFFVLEEGINFKVLFFAEYLFLLILVQNLNDTYGYALFNHL